MTRRDFGELYFADGISVHAQSRLEPKSKKQADERIETLKKRIKRLCNYSQNLRAELKEKKEAEQWAHDDWAGRYE